MISNQAAVDDAEEEFNLTEVEFGEGGTNPNPELEPSDSPDSPDAIGVAEGTTVTQSSTIIKKKRAQRNAAEERQTKKNAFINMCRLNSLSMQENSGAERKQRRKEQRASHKIMQMNGTGLASMVAAWATGNKAASAVFRPGQQSVIKELNEEQEEALEE